MVGWLFICSDGLLSFTLYIDFPLTDLMGSFELIKMDGLIQQALQIN